MPRRCVGRGGAGGKVRLWTLLSMRTRAPAACATSFPEIGNAMYGDGALLSQNFFERINRKPNLFPRPLQRQYSQARASVHVLYFTYVRTPPTISSKSILLSLLAEEESRIEELTSFSPFGFFQIRFTDTHGSFLTKVHQQVLQSPAE